jgi:predicted GIY-YIG superfamily endonuclease
MVGDTYIIETTTGEFYCGYTTNIQRRMKEHLKEKYPHWFGINRARKLWYEIFIIPEKNYEKDIKRFGIAKFIWCIKAISKANWVGKPESLRCLRP